MPLSPLSCCCWRNYTKSIFFVYLCTTISFIYSLSTNFVHISARLSCLDAKPPDSRLWPLLEIIFELFLFRAYFIFSGELMTSQTLNLHTNKSSYGTGIMALCGVEARKQLTKGSGGRKLECLPSK